MLQAAAQNPTRISGATTTMIAWCADIVAPANLTVQARMARIPSTRSPDQEGGGLQEGQRGERRDHRDHDNTLAPNGG